MSTVAEADSRMRRFASNTPWLVVKLGDIAEFIMGQAPPGDASNFEGRGTIFVKAGEFGPLHPVVREWTTKPLRFGRNGDIFICVVGATAGKLNLGIDCAIGRSVAAIRPNQKTFDRFVYLQLLTKVLELRAGSTGSAQGVINRDMLAKIDIFLLPLPEQRRIVAEVEKQFTRLEAGVTALRRVQANLKRYRAAVLKAACEGRLVPTEAELAKAENRKAKFESGEALLAHILNERCKNWKGRNQYREPATSDTTSLPPIPEGWTWTNIGQLAEVGTGATPNRGKSKYFVGGQIPWVTSGRVNSPRIDKADQFVTSTALEECNLTIYPPGTLLLAMYGEGKTRGMASELGIHATTNQALAAIQTPTTIQGFIKVVLWKNYEDVRKSASGGVQPNLNLSIVRAIPVPFPPPSEQTRIVAEVERRLSMVEELEAVVTANLQRANRLRQAILASAFSQSAE